jgi:hypothetical protein
MVPAPPPLVRYKKEVSVKQVGRTDGWDAADLVDGVGHVLGKTQL